MSHWKERNNESWNIFHPVERENITVKLLWAASWHNQMGACVVLDSWGVNLIPSFSVSGAESLKPFHQIQWDGKDCLHGYVKGHQRGMQRLFDVMWSWAGSMRKAQVCQLTNHAPHTSGLFSIRAGEQGLNEAKTIWWRQEGRSS